VKKWNGLIDPNETLPHVDVNMQGQGFVFVSSLNFSYAIEGSDSEMQSVPGLKPFGSEWVKQGQGGYHYLFDLTVIPALGFGIEGAIELRLPGLPSNFLADTSFAGNQKFVTAERAFKLLNIHKVDVAGKT